MNKKKHIHEDPNSFRDMKCNLCENCYELYNHDFKLWTGRCIYGGPYHSYLVDKDYKIPDSGKNSLDN